MLGHDFLLKYQALISDFPRLLFHLFRALLLLFHPLVIHYYLILMLLRFYGCWVKKPSLCRNFPLVELDALLKLFLLEQQVAIFLDQLAQAQCALFKSFHGLARRPRFRRTFWAAGTFWMGLYFFIPKRRLCFAGMVWLLLFGRGFSIGVDLHMLRITSSANRAIADLCLFLWGDGPKLLNMWVGTSWVAEFYWGCGSWWPARWIC